MRFEDPRFPKNERLRQAIRDFLIALREDAMVVGLQEATRQRWMRHTYQLYVLSYICIILSVALLMFEQYLGVYGMQDGTGSLLSLVYVCVFGVVVFFLPTITTHAVFRIRRFRITIPSRWLYGMLLGYGFGLSASFFVFFLAHQFLGGVTLIALTTTFLHYVQKRCLRWFNEHPQTVVIP